MKGIQQRIYLSRRNLNSIEFEHEVLRIPLRVGEETSFEVFVINYGEPTHVHFSVGGEIKDKVMILRDKVYVVEKEKMAVVVKLPKSNSGIGLVSGKIFIATGYGATKEGFLVEIVEEKMKMMKEKRGEKKRREKEVEVSPEERRFLLRLTVSTVTAALLLVFVFIVITFPLSLPYSFACSLVSSLLLIFLVIYNLSW